MVLKSLTEIQMQEIYETHMVHDFPLNELKPFEYISKLLNEELYFAYGLYENDKLFAYAFLCRTIDGKYLLLDYLAVCKNTRNKGFGSICLSLLKEECQDYHGIFIEVENVAYASSEEERSIRNRRILFYERNDAVRTNLSCKLFGVDMQIMLLDIKENQEETALYEELNTVYLAMFGPKIYSEKVELIERM